MTFSICAYDPATGQLGVGAITAMLGVGKLVSHARAGVGAAASQAMMNPYLALDGLELMTTGQTAQQALEEVISRDDGRDYRQVGVVDAQGNTAAWSGARTEDWSGHLQRGSAVAQGNRLVGIETLEATLDAFYDNQHLDLAHRLLRALQAGEATGADTKGSLSGAIYVVDTEEYPLWDVRIDHAEDPAAALESLVDEFEDGLLPQVVKLPARADQLGQMTREAMAKKS
ncbi:DUF1028 domain-containing protein [[Mycobacterium] burgundiense]|uniref:DUF1028 domain-containing protein n=1 Tax=[Mycobacterium] burgundiense TaxID=3064286 RepID=A0ABN9NEC8_9MYCO|nr:DUF1028 domain-containing protein [Mycolicibacterium sp. MU0053]CAJ1504988.1 DUF1028 domain-containing protein [Mycolicibacterium sp. MU0053]